MELVAVLRVLWRRRLLVLLGAAAAVGLAMFMSRGTTPPVGIAWTRLMLDTGKSQLLRADPAGADSLTWRAELLSDLLSDDATTVRIARDAGIPAGQLRVIEPRLLAPEVETALPLRATKASAVVVQPYTITVEYDATLPILTLEARGPDQATATRLAKAATGALAADDVPQDSSVLQGLVIAPMTPVIKRVAAQKSKLVASVGMAAVFFLFCCCGIAVLPSASRIQRAAARRLRHA